MILYFYIFIFIFGACIGSFLNVVVLRLKDGQKITGRSHCPKCGHILKWYENIPLLSFFILRGRCSKCRQKISWQYPLVEFATGFLFLIAFIITLQSGGQTIQQFNNLTIYSITLLLYYFITISFLILIFTFDLKYYLIPDKISIPAIILALFFQILLLIFKNQSLNSLISNFLFLIFSAIIISGFFALQFILSRGRWVGGGDIRLGFLMGIILGWPLGLLALFLAYILGSLVCLPLLILKNKGLKSEVPFGTFLAIATLVVLFWGQKLLDWYLSFF